MFIVLAVSEFLATFAAELSSTQKKKGKNMKKILLTLIVVLSSHLMVNAQEYNTVFPIVNTVSTHPEFVGASVYMTQSYMGRSLYIADALGLYDDRGVFRELDESGYGSFVSFNYVTKKKATTNGEWNTGAETTQIAWHPGGRKETYGKNSITDSPLYAFCFSEKDGLVLYDLNNLNVVAVLDNGNNIKQYTSLTVFAGSDYTMEDVIVISGENKFKIFGTISGGSNGVRQIFSSNAAPSFFDINGDKLNAPQRGINIVVDGETSKKVVVK